MSVFSISKTGEVEIPSLTINNSTKLKGQLRLALSCLNNFKRDKTYNILIEQISLRDVVPILSEFCGKPGLIVTCGERITEVLYDVPSAELFVHAAPVYQDKVWIAVVRAEHLADHLFQRAEDMDKNPWRAIPVTEVTAVKGDLISLSWGA